MIKTIKTHKEQFIASQDIIDDIICNCCGESITELDQNSDYLHIEKDWGYFSPFDLENHKFDICDKCYTSFIGTFKIPVAKQINVF